MTETLRTRNGRPVLRIERRLAHPPAKVWRAITEPAHLSQWYPFAATAIDLRVGGMIRFDDGQGMSMDAVIVELDPPRVFAFSEHAPDAMTRESDDLVHIELRPDGEGCLLIFTHTFDDRPAAASYGAGWHTCLDALALLLDGRPAGQTTDVNQLHEHYVEVFGLAEGAAEEQGDTWRVRFERQLTRPAEQVWAMLRAPDPSAPEVGGAVPGGFLNGEVEAGALTAVEAPALLEYEWLASDGAAGRVRWELSSGTGHGARLVLTQTGPRELAAERSRALAAWKSRIERLARQLLGGSTAPGELGKLSPTADGRLALRFERRLAHPPAKVWRAITEPEQLRAWFPALVTFELAPGARLRFAPTPEQQARYGLPDLEPSATNGAVTRVEPHKLLEYTWDAETIRWELSPDGSGGCRLVFTHLFDERDLSTDVSAGWHAGLEIFEAQLDGRPVDWSIWERAEQLKADYPPLAPVE